VIGFLFPGQGSQVVGMGADLAAAFPTARATFEEADHVLGWALSRLMQEGPAEELTATANAQPALLAHSVACLRVLAELGAAPGMVAGHSLGEWSACVAAAALDFPTALRLVRARGQFMAEAALRQGGGMAAILGLEEPQVRALCTQAQEVGLVRVANSNAPGQVVVSGEEAAVDRACALAKESGAKGAVRLRVSGPFHTPLMAEAQERLAGELAAAEVADAHVPLVSNVDARARTSGSEIRRALTEQVTGTVRWQECVHAMTAAGVDRFAEVGLGNVLAGLLRRLAPAVPCWAAGTAETIRETAEQLRSETP